MDLAEIEEKWRLSGQCTSELDTLFADDAFNGLIKEVERLKSVMQRIATFYDDGESDFSGDTPTSLAKEALQVSGK